MRVFSSDAQVLVHHLGRHEVAGGREDQVVRALKVVVDIGVGGAGEHVGQREHGVGDADEEEHAHQSAALLALQQGGGDDVRQIANSDGGDPAAQQVAHEAGNACKRELELGVNAVQHALQEIEGFRRIAVAADEKTEIEEDDAQKERAAQQGGQGVFDHFCAEDLVGAVGGHEQHIALAGVHVPMERDDALDAHEQDAEDADHGHDEQDDALTGGIVFACLDEENHFADDGGGEERQLHEQGFAHFIFHQFEHLTSPPYVRRWRGSGPPWSRRPFRAFLSGPAPR